VCVSRWIAVACIAASLAACRSTGLDLEDARAEVMAAERGWAVAAKARDLERSISYVADDAIMYPPGSEPVVGKRAIRDYMASAFAIPGFSVSWEPEAVVVAAAGDLAYTRTRSVYTVPGSEGAVQTIHAKGVSVWRRESDGHWRCVVDIWNEAPAPARSRGP
jgi:uncharacterized protein (TIGR02246 family)